MKQSSTVVARSVFVLLSGLLMLLLCSSAGFGQRVVAVPPGFGTLNNVLQGDTTALGARVDTNTVYQLARDGFYLLNGTLDHRYPVNIQAAPGAGAKPIIIQGVASGGTAGTEAWAPRATLRMKNIYMSAIDELGGGHERVIRIRENNVHVEIDSCVLDQATQAGFRFDAKGAKVYVRNSVISNIGTGASPDNGRGFDDRGNDIDTLVLENSTFYNLTSRVIRDAGGITNFCKTNHCTMYNIGQWGISYGPCVTAVYTNNLLINAAYYGQSPNGTKRSVVELLPLPGGATQNITINNNAFYLDSAIIKVYPDTVSVTPRFDSSWTHYIQQQGSQTTLWDEDIVFTNAPDDPANVVTDWYLNPAPPNPDLDTTGGPFNFAYPNTQLAYTRGSDGKPLGDLNWFHIPLTAIREMSTGEPVSFQLHQAYPNPFNPETNIRFDLAKTGSVSLEVFNLLGQKVATLVDGTVQAGSHEVRWNGRRDDGSAVSSGAYVCRLISAGSVATTKMMLVR